MDSVLTGDGCRIAYRWDGPSDAPKLILSNSLGTAMAMWAPQIEALSTRFRMLRYDVRGHGLSSAPAGAYSIDRLGRDVVEMMDAFGVERASFCGLSMGGMVGQWLGLRAPKRLDRLVLANTSSFMGPPSAWDQRISLVLDKGMSALTDAVLERWFTPAFRDAAPDAVQPVREMLLATQPVGYAGCCAAIRDMDMTPLLGLITVPTLVIGGTDDPATPPPHAAQLASRIPGAKLLMLSAAHLSNVEQAANFTYAVADHIGFRR